MKKYLISLIVLSLFAVGCVTSGTYNIKKQEAEQLSQKNSSLTQNLEKLKQEKDKLHQEKDQLISEKDGLLSEKDGLTRKSQNLEKERQALTENLNKEKESSTKQGEELHRQIEEEQKQIDELKKSITNLEVENNDIKNSLKFTRDEKAKKITELLNEKKERDQRLAELETNLQKEKTEKEEKLKELSGTVEGLKSNLENELKKGEVIITQIKDKLSINLLDKIIFSSGSAEISKEGKEVLDKVGVILRTIKDKQIRVEGHTDNIPIKESLREKFPTNWELSAARAANIVRYLKDSIGIGPHLLAVSGYGEYRPIAANDTLEGRAQNRRVEILILPLDITKVIEEIK